MKYIKFGFWDSDIEDTTLVGDVVFMMDESDYQKFIGTINYIKTLDISNIAITGKGFGGCVCYRSGIDFVNCIKIKELTPDEFIEEQEKMMKNCRDFDSDTNETNRQRVDNVYAHINMIQNLSYY
jgi:hypothetical protein